VIAGLPAIEADVSAHLGRPWTVRRVTDLDELASHPAALLHGDGLSVFVKTGPAEPFRAELRGLELVRDLAGVRTPRPVGSGVLALDGTAALLLEALPERPPEARTDADWRAVGRTLATLHQVRGPEHGLAGLDGWFGPLAQDNRPVPGATWAEFYTARRLLPRLRGAADSGHLPAALVPALERVAGRLPELAGPEPVPALLHGDAQQNNWLVGDAGVALIDVAPCFGHPEWDLALVDYFDPVPAALFDAYREVRPIDPGFPARRELWRLAAYLAVVEVDGGNPFGRGVLSRLAAAVARLG
jgi:fructosamine-3-kinase